MKAAGVSTIYSNASDLSSLHPTVLDFVFGASSLVDSVRAVRVLVTSCWGRLGGMWSSGGVAM